MVHHLSMVFQPSSPRLLDIAILDDVRVRLVASQPGTRRLKSDDFWNRYLYGHGVGALAGDGDQLDPVAAEIDVFT
jgi:hypothetical protein